MHAEPNADTQRAAPPAPLIALLTFGTGGDLQPFLTLAEGLQRRGRRTLLIVPKFHEERVQGTGLAYLPFGTHEQSQSVLADPDLWDERKGFGVVWRGVLPSVDALQDLLVSAAGAGPCIVVSHPFLVPVAAMACEQSPALRIVGAYLAPSSLRTVHDPLTIGSLNLPSWVPVAWRRALWRLIDRRWIDPDLLPGLNAARAGRGLEAVPSFLDHMQSACDASIGLFPSWFAHRQPDWPLTFHEGQFPLRPPSRSLRLSAELESFLAAGEAPIVLTPGTGHRHAARLFRDALSALRALGRRGLFITPYPEQLPAPLPPEVLWQSHVPFDALLPRAAMLVHHGGIGTTAEALRAGIPQLILPFAFDQFDNGQRIQRLGAGLVVPASRASARRLRQAIAALLARPVSGPTKSPAFERDTDRELEKLLDSVECALASANRLEARQTAA
jgi:rhamnosyltransferase subunit B